MTRIQPEFFENSLREIGALFDPKVLEATRQLYRPHLLLEPAGDEQTDVAYGPDDRHRLDVYLPAAPVRGIAVFVHGGGFVGGNKNIDGTFYPNVGRWLARQGYVGVLPNYRLAPAHPWPAAADDIGGVLDWVVDHRGSLARAEAPVVLWGQSAGAAHVATWLFDPRQRGRTMCDRLAGVMMMSGFYEAIAPLHGGPLAYFGADEALYPDRSALTHVVPTAVPLWLGVAELDPPWLAAHTFAMARALNLTGGSGPAFHYFRGHNHVSTVQSLGSPHTSSGAEVLRMLNNWTASNAT